ncbi:MAG TPA: NAD(P)/FAD-dependent oxidoreductase [Thermodesulfobacteriota bacterium]|nr:NAD(P)/FAD-dependent oxidoreductase [Thermodesulfobacteriota bacterium]
MTATATATERIVILGAGYGGLTCALRLGRRLRRRPNRQVTLVDRNPYHLLETRLHEAATRGVEVTIPIGRALRGLPVDFRLGEAVGIDPAARRVRLADGTELDYTYCVIAVGSRTHFYDIPGLEQHALELKTLEDSQRIRDRVERLFARARAEVNPQVRREMLTFVVGGGGLTGVELAGELADRCRALAAEHGLAERDYELIVCELSDTILPMLEPRLRQKAAEILTAKGVRILTGTRVLGMTEGRIRIEPGGELRAQTLVWTGGIRAADLVRELPGVETGPQGRILVDEFLQVKGHPELFAIGDAALAINPATGRAVPAAAQFALQQGRLTADNLVARLEGRPMRPYRPRVLGEVISLGRHMAVGWVALVGWRARLRFVGFLASLIKRAIAEKHVVLLWRERQQWLGYS